MNRIDRYLARSILGTTVIVALALVAIFTFTTFIAEIDKLGNGFGFGDLAAYTLLNLPFTLQSLLPIIAMLGALMGLGNLAGQGEITAVRAAGISDLRIGRAALLAGLVVGLLGWLSSDWLAPQGRQAAERLKTEIRYGSNPGASLKPIWLRDGPHIVHIVQLVSERQARKVTIYTLDEQMGLTAVMSVDQADYMDDHWWFSGVRRTRFGANGIQADTLERLDWGGDPAPEVLRLFVLEARSLTASGLMGLIDYLDQNGLDAKAQRFALWRKLIAPLTITIMAFVAVPFATGHARRGGAGLRLMLGVMLGVLFYVLDQVTGSFGLLYGWHPALAAGLPTVLLGSAAWVRLALAR